jgi:Polycystin cation channel
MKDAYEDEPSAIEYTGGNNTSMHAKNKTIYSETPKTLELTEKDHEEIKKKLKKCKKDIQSSLSEGVSKPNLILPISSSLMFILLILYIARISLTAEMSNLIISVYEDQEWNSYPQKFLSNVSSLPDLNDYVMKNVLANSFDSDNYLQSYNYVCGIRFSLKLGNMIRNPIDSNFSQSFVKESTSYSASSSNTGEEKNQQGLWTYTYDSYKKAGGFTSYFMNTNYDEALYNWRLMNTIWLNENAFVSLAIEMIFHNSNLETTLYYYQVFEYQDSGQMIIQTGTSGISPEVYVAKGTEFVVILIIFSMYLVTLILETFRIVDNFQKKIVVFFKTRKNTFTMHEGLEFVLLTLILTIVVMYIMLDLANIGQFTLPLDENSFDKVIDYANEFSNLLRIASLCCMLYIIRVVLVLKFYFPSFGVLFDTIAYSRGDLVNFLSITGILFVGFSLCGSIALGTEDYTFSTIANSVNRFFSMLVGILDINRTIYINDSFKNALIIFFVFLFYFVFVRMLTAIVMGTYIYLQNKNHLLLIAKAEMIAEKSKKFMNLVIDLILFRKKDNIDAEVLEYYNLKKMLDEDSDVEDKDDMLEKMKLLENSIRRSTKFSFINTFKANLAALSSFFTEYSLKNKELVVKEFKKCIKSILEKEKLEEKERERKELDVDYNFYLLKEMIIYILFIILYSVATFIELDISNSYALQDICRKSVFTPEFTSSFAITLDQVTSSNEIYAFLYYVIAELPNGIGYDNNIIYPINTIRITLQFHNIYPNQASFSNQVMPEVVGEGYNHSSFRGDTTKILYRYFDPGTPNTFQSLGGFVCTVQNYKQSRLIAEMLYLDNVLDYKNSYVAVDWVIYNVNLDTYVYNYIYLDQSVSGQYSVDFYSRSIGAHFHSGGSLGILAIQIIATIVYSYFIFKVVIEILGEWKVHNALRLKKERDRRLIKIIIDYLSGEPEPENRSCVQAIKYFIFNVVDVTRKYFVLTLQVFYSYYLSFFRIIETVSIILTLMCLFMCFSIKSSPIQLNNMSGFSESSKWIDKYYLLLAFNFFFLYIKILKYSLFSSKVYDLFNVIRKARIDFLFFIMMFMTILLGFTLMGYIIFGHYHPGYKDFASSFISCYMMKFGIFDYSIYTQADPYLGELFIVVFIIIMMLFLSSMFTAIIAGYFMNMDRTHAHKLGIFEKILRVIKGKYYKETVLITDRTKKSSKTSSSEASDKDSHSDSFNNEEHPEALNVNHSNNIWMTQLEICLELKAGKDLKFPDFKMNRKKYSEKKLLDKKDLAFFNPKQWENESFESRIVIWNSLSFYYKESCLIKEESKAWGNFEPYPLVSELQREVWESMSIAEQLSIWLGDLTIEGRLDIWNLIPYPDDLKTSWPGLSLADKIKTIKSLLKVTKKYKSVVGNAKDPSEFISKLEIPTKSKYWLCLYGRTNIKLELLLNLADTLEFEIISYSIICDSYENIALIENYDILISKFLDNAIYCKITELSWLKFEKSEVQRIKNATQEELDRCRSLLEYKSYLLSNQKKEKHQRSVLRSLFE